MEVIALVRLFWQRKLLVLAGVLVAVGAAVALGGSPVPPRGYAISRVLLDTSKSQLVAGNPDGVDTLAWRATFAANLVADDASRRAMATKLGVPLEQVSVTNLELTIPAIPASLPRAATKAANESSTPYALVLHTDNTVPLISISATAPDRAAAVRLTAAAVDALRAVTDAQESKLSLGLSLQTVSPTDSIEIPGGQGRKKVAVFAIFILFMWCATIAVFPVFLRALRAVLDAAASPA